MTDQPGTSGGGWTTPEQPGSGAPYGSPAPGTPQPAAQAQQGWGQYSGAEQPRYGAVITRRGIIALKPLGIGDFFDGSFRAIRHNPRVMIGLTALVVGVSSLLIALPATGMLTTIGLDESGPTDSEALAALGFVGALVPAVLLQGVALIVLTGLLILSVSQSVVDRRLRLGELWRRARGRLLPLVGWSILQSIAATLLFGIALTPGIALLVVEELVGGIVAIVVLLVLATVLSVWVFVVLALVPALIVVERLSIIASIRRSYALVRGAFWRTLLILFLASILTGFVTQALALPLGFAGGLLAAFFASNEAVFFTINVVVTVVGGSAGAVIAMPFFAAVVALLYIDRRIRLEGLDVALGRTLEDRPA